MFWNARTKTYLFDSYESTESRKILSQSILNHTNLECAPALAAVQLHRFLGTLGVKEGFDFDVLCSSSVDYLRTTKESRTVE